MGRQYTHLGPEERGRIAVMRGMGASGRQIAQALGRSPSTVTRELRRNGERLPGGQPLLGRPRQRLGYDPVQAGERAARLHRKPRRPRRLQAGSALWAEVRCLLARRWSPRAISRTLRRQHPADPAWHVSHETIYRAIYATPRGALRRELTACLRQHRRQRRPRSRGADRRGRLPGLASIHVRPPEANDRLLPGHWEGDFLVGARNQSAVGVLVDRSTLFVVLARMRDATAAGALEGFTRALSPLPEAARRTLTYDQGKEMAMHAILAERTGLAIYFADPHSPWQRGICENTNGLLRDYLPKGTDLSSYSQAELDHIARELNHRPRATLGFHCPAEVFARKLGQHELADRIDSALLD